MPGRLTGVRRWGLYYGPGAPAALAGYDLAVVAPEAWPQPLRREAAGGGTLLLAYLPALEVPAQGPPPEGALRVGGGPVVNARFGNYILDPRHPDTVRRVLRQVSALQRAGWAGCFLDTLADVETDLVPAALRPHLIPAAAALVEQIATCWPGAPLVVNWTLGPLLPLVAPYIDGLCWEDFPYRELRHSPPDGPLRRLAQRVRRLAVLASFAVLALNQAPADPALAAATAAEWGFVWYGTPRYTAPPARAAP